jgi:hypothetical protein
MARKGAKSARQRVRKAKPEVEATFEVKKKDSRNVDSTTPNGISMR